MEKNTTPSLEKTFKFRFTPLMLILAYAVVALCLFSIGLSIARIVNEGIHSFLDALKSPFLIAICLFGIVIVVGVLVRSRYVIKEETLIMQLGFIKSKFAIKEITSLLLDTDAHKLTVYMGEEFFVLVTSPEYNHDFVQALREVNPDIEFSFTLAEKKNEEK